MLGDGAFAGLEDACDEVEKGGFAGSVGAENGYAGVHTVGGELVRFETAGAGKRSGEMSQGRKGGREVPMKRTKVVEQGVEMDEARRVGATNMIEITVGMNSEEGCENRGRWLDFKDGKGIWR